MAGNLFSHSNLETLSAFISTHPTLTKQIDSEGKTLLHHAIIGIREQLLAELLNQYREPYYSHCGGGNPCEPAAVKNGIPYNDGLFLDDAYKNFLTELIKLNPAALHIKDNEESFAACYVVQNTQPAPHTIVFTSLLSFLLQQRASIAGIFLDDLNIALKAAHSEAANLALVANIEKPLSVFSMFRQHEKSTRRALFAPEMFVNYLKQKIQLDTIFLQILPVHLQGKAVLPLELLHEIVRLFSGLKPAETSRLGAAVQTDYENRGIVARRL